LRLNFSSSNFVIVQVSMSSGTANGAGLGSRNYCLTQSWSWHQNRLRAVPLLKLRLPSPYLGTQKRCLLKLQRAQSEPPFKPHPWSRTEPKIVPMTTLFGALSGSTAPPAFFLWPPSFSSRFLTFSPAPTFLPTFASTAPAYVHEMNGLMPVYNSLSRQIIHRSRLDSPQIQ